jgi:chromosome segregation ATPase
MKNVVIILAVVVALISAVVAYFDSRSADVAENELNRERYTRMVTEEDLLKANQRIGSLEKELTSLKSQLEKNDALLKQAMTLKNELQTQLDQAIEKKDSLERKMKDISQMPVQASPATSTGDI